MDELSTGENRYLFDHHDPSNERSPALNKSLPRSWRASSIPLEPIPRKPVAHGYEGLPSEQHVSPVKITPHVTNQKATATDHALAVFRQWWFEIFSCVVMLGMLFAIVGVLYPYKGKPLPEWPFRLSINTVISVLVTVLKAAALLILSEGLGHLKWQWFTSSRPLIDLSWFDAASRGPWGCLRLLLAPRGLHLVASTGAALVVLSLALDPFTQQLVHYYDCQINSTTLQATIPRSNFYDEAGSHISPGVWPPATPLIAYINQGLYAPATLQTPFTCSTGNCTFDSQYSTLGWCATCEDASPELHIFNWTTTEEQFDPRTNQTVKVPSWLINTTLPSGASVGFRGFTSNEDWFRVKANSSWIEILLAATALPGSNQSWYNQHYMARIFRGSRSDAYGCTTDYENSTWACHGVGGSGAARCNIKPCVRTYEASVKRGKLTETLVAANTDMAVVSSENGAPMWMMADLSCAGNDVRRRLQRAGFNISDTTNLIPWNVEVDISSGNPYAIRSIVPSSAHSLSTTTTTIPGPPLNTTGLPLDIVPGKCIYQLYYYAYNGAIDNFLLDYVSGVLSPAANDDAVIGPPQVRAIWNDTYVGFAGINQTFQGVAEAMTLRVRVYGLPGALPLPDPVLGVVQEDRTCVEVRWGYFAYPVVLVAFTSVFLITLVSQAVFSQKNARIARGWKLSPLPTIFGGLHVGHEMKMHQRCQDSLHLVNTESDIDEMEGSARLMRARLNFSQRNYNDYNGQY